MHLDPIKNSGYTMWDPIPNASYKVKILERSGTTYNAVSSFTTNNNYTRFDPAIFLIPNTYYQIDAEDAHGIVVNTTGPTRPNNAEGLGSEPGCYVGCIGTSYAWSIQQYREILGYDNNGPLLGPSYFRANGLAIIVDEPNGIYAPYWQAINTNSWNVISNMGSSHPYNSSFYTKVNIPPGATYYDAQTSAVTSGKLVSKGMDQFSRFAGVQTPTSASFGTDLCVFLPGGTPLSAAEFFATMNFYNNYHLTPTANLFNYFTPSADLECTLAYGYGYSSPYFDSESGDTIGDGDPIDDWILQDFYAELDDFLNGGGGIHKPGGVFVTDWKQLNDEFEGLTDLNGNHGIRVTHVTINSILDDEVSVTYELDEEEGLILREIEGELKKGLYQMTIFTNQSSIIIPSVIEIASDLPTPQDKDYFELTIAPNPVANNQLEYVVVGRKVKNVTAIIFNLNGDIIQTHSIPFTATNPRFIGTLDLTNVATPYNQIKISLIFQDGSLIQKTALKP